MQKYMNLELEGNFERDVFCLLNDLIATLKNNKENMVNMKHKWEYEGKKILVPSLSFVLIKYLSTGHFKYKYKNLIDFNINLKF